jgi:hypothetical protein
MAHTHTLCHTNSVTHAHAHAHTHTRTYTTHEQLQQLQSGNLMTPILLCAVILLTPSPQPPQISHTAHPDQAHLGRRGRFQACRPHKPLPLQRERRDQLTQASAQCTKRTQRDRIGTLAADAPPLPRGSGCESSPASARAHLRRASLSQVLSVT